VDEATKRRSETLHWQKTERVRRSDEATKRNASLAENGTRSSFLNSRDRDCGCGLYNFVGYSVRRRDGPWRQAHKSLLGTVLNSLVCGRATKIAGVWTKRRSDEAKKRNAFVLFK
jgi:hypothetical protein